MVDIVATNHISTKSLMENIELYRYNPSAIQRTILDYLEATTNGEVDIVDPTNPFVFLLEASCVNTAVAISENRLATRKQYPILAQTEEELYIHMSDKDFVGRFAAPSETNFTFLISRSSMLENMVDDLLEECQKLVIPRNTEVTIENWTFSLEYPIVIRRYANNVLQISYDAISTSPLRALSTNVIDHIVIKNANGSQFIKFTVPLSQFRIETHEFPVQTSTAFLQTVAYSDKYCYCRVFYKKERSTSGWVEMRTTHTEQVYDPYKPTAVLKVLNSDNTVKVYIPNIYINDSTVDGTVRVDIYTTKGKLTVDMNNYLLTSFKSTLRAIDDVADSNAYTEAMGAVSYLVYSDTVVSGGNDPLSFADLRERVINNAVGLPDIPITNVQLESNAERGGFKIVRNVDIVTNRIFIATRSLPSPSNPRLITSANISIETFICNMAKLASNSQVFVNGGSSRITLPSTLLYVYNNGLIDIVSDEDLDKYTKLPLTKLSEITKNTKFLYTPFYYVLGTVEDEFEVRAYHLDQPKLTNLNFVEQNPTAQLQVNTASFSIEKTKTGYTILVSTKSDNVYKELRDSYVSLQLSFLPKNETNRVFMNGTQLSRNSSSKERVYEFRLLSNHDIDTFDQIYIDNFNMTEETLNINTPVPLSARFDLYYTTTSIPDTFKESKIDSMLGKAHLPPNSIGVTHETIDVTLGHSLKNLWTQSRSVVVGDEYKRYQNDVPMYYEEDVYDLDPVTGSTMSVDLGECSISFNLLHEKGDIVRNSAGEIAYAHRKGDAILDNYGNPIKDQSLSVEHYCDILFVDGCYYWSTDPNYKTYRSELASVLDKWIYVDLENLNKTLLEQTRIYYYPRKSIGKIEISLSDNNQTTVEAQQSLTVSLYVKENIYKDTQMRDDIRQITVSYLNAALQKSIISMSTITSDLRGLYGDGVVSFNIEGFGGNKNYEVVSLINEHEQFCLKKYLVAQEDGTTIVAEDVTLNFINFSQ